MDDNMSGNAVDGEAEEPDWAASGKGKPSVDASEATISGFSLSLSIMFDKSLISKPSLMGWMSDTVQTLARRIRAPFS